MSNFRNFLEKIIEHQMMLGATRNEMELTGARNLKSDFDYKMSKSSTKDEAEIILSIYKERLETADIYKDTKTDLYLQEMVEANLIKPYVPKEPSKNEVLAFLNTLTDEKSMKNFKVFIEKCKEHFGIKVNSKYIQDFIKGTK